MNLNIPMLAAAAIMLPSLSAQAADGITILESGPNSSIIKIMDASQPFLLLPVQESNGMTHMRVITDGVLSETLNIALATDKVDFMVPLDLRKWQGKDIVIDVALPAEAGANASDKRLWEETVVLADSFDATNREPLHRPAYHHAPAYGWMNDPNGMFYKDGKWHLYYQWNPYGSKWENMTWGHSSSTDLINWQAEPVAIKPIPMGTIFSGSAVVDSNNTAGFGKDAIVALFTSAARNQTQSLAYSTDNGQTWTEYSANPVVTYPEESRDPNFFWDAKHNQWVLAVASALAHEVLFYTSPNLKDWTLVSKFGKGFGAQEGVWECPDLMEIPVQGTDEKKWVLLLNLNPGGIQGGSATQYFVGEWNGREFKCDNGPEVTKWMDYGKDHYATVSFSGAPDDRRTVIAWMSNWEYAPEVPTQQFRSANSLPRDLSLTKAPDGEYYLVSTPSPETLALRGKEYKAGNFTASAAARKINLPASADGLYELVMKANVPAGAQLEIALSNKLGQRTTMLLDGTKKSFAMDRTKSGLVDFSQHFPTVTEGPIPDADGNYEIRFYVDRASIEAFVNNGSLSMTNLVFPEAPYTSLTMRAPQGKVKCSDIRIYPIAPKAVPHELK